jgi:hypothetical protein
VIRIAHGNGRDAMRLRAPDRLVGRQHRENVSDTVVAVDQRDRARIDGELRLRDRLHHAITDAVEIPAEAQGAVRLVSPQVRLHQRIRNEARVRRGDADTFVNRCAEVDEALGIDTRFSGHGVLRGAARVTSGPEFLTLSLRRL